MERAKGFEAAPDSRPVSLETGEFVYESMIDLESPISSARWRAANHAV